MTTTPADSPAPAPTSRCGVVAIVGRANVGKSTLMNRILGEKVAIVSPVAQTTRNLVRGIHTEARGQIAFVDTPGILKSSHALGVILNRAARSAVAETDCALLVLDASSPPHDEDEGWMRKLCGSHFPLLFVLNKTDIGTQHAAAFAELWQKVCTEKNVQRDVPWLRVSASRGEGVDGLLGTLFPLLPVGPHLFPDDIISDYPRKLQIADLIRERYFAELHAELPHAIAVAVLSVDETPKEWLVRATVYVNKHSQKLIVIGEKGRLIRKVTRSSERVLSEIYDIPVRVELWVKVQPDWDRNFWILRELGHA